MEGPNCLRQAPPQKLRGVAQRIGPRASAASCLVLRPNPEGALPPQTPRLPRRKLGCFAASSFLPRGRSGPQALLGKPKDASGLPSGRPLSLAGSAPSVPARLRSLGYPTTEVWLSEISFTSFRLQAASSRRDGNHRSPHLLRSLRQFRPLARSLRSLRPSLPRSSSASSSAASAFPSVASSLRSTADDRSDSPPRMPGGSAPWTPGPLVWLVRWPEATCQTNGRF